MIIASHPQQVCHFAFKRDPLGSKMCLPVVLGTKCNYILNGILPLVGKSDDMMCLKVMTVAIGFQKPQLSAVLAPPPGST